MVLPHSFCSLVRLREMYLNVIYAAIVGDSSDSEVSVSGDKLISVLLPFISFRFYLSDIFEP